MPTGYGLQAWGIDLGSGGGENVRPVVTLISPIGAPIRKTSEIKIRVFDNAGLALVSIVAKYASGFAETIYDGYRYTPLFETSSREQLGPAQFDFTLRRRGGWPAAPRIVVEPVDTSGNTADSTVIDV